MVVNKLHDFKANKNISKQDDLFQNWTDINVITWLYFPIPKKSPCWICKPFLS